MRILDSGKQKACISPIYNYVFTKKSGFFARWGRTEKEDPQWSPFGPELLDIEISSGGDCLGRCPYCYKCNGGDSPTHNMTFEQFKIIIDKMPPVLTQVAFGIMNISTNPDFFKMMEYTRKKGIVPNYTCHGLDVTEENARKTAELEGAVSVSFVRKESTYKAVKMFLKAGVDQVNIHYMLSEETYDRAFKIVDDISSDDSLRGLRAIVFLQYKAKGRTPDEWTPVVNVDKYKKLIRYCEDKQIGYGFDSCSAYCFMESIKDKEDSSQLMEVAEPCESGLFSSYINCKGFFYACSFCENEGEWSEGLDVLHCNNFLNDIWYSKKVVAWRKHLISEKRQCPIFKNLQIGV